MVFGLNTLAFSHVIKFPYSLGVYFKVNNRSIHVNVDNTTPQKWKANLLWALEIERTVPDNWFDLGKILYNDVTYGHEILGFLHYHKELGEKQYTFLHIPGTFDHGVVFDRKGEYNYLPRIDTDGSLVYVDTRTKDRSLITRKKEYMESTHVKPQGILTINN